MLSSSLRVPSLPIVRLEEAESVAVTVSGLSLFATHTTFGSCIGMFLCQIPTYCLLELLRMKKPNSKI
ncbi:hypothetical protein ACSBR1_016207 [Camellia fascicularis]